MVEVEPNEEPEEHSIRPHPVVGTTDMSPVRPIRAWFAIMTSDEPVDDQLSPIAARNAMSAHTCAQGKDRGRYCPCELYSGAMGLQCEFVAF
jgi:hypothetical protein